MASLPYSREFLSLGLSAMLLLSSTQALASERITCESRNNRYNHCRIDTDNRVKLKRQISDAPCIEGRTWGYDKKGVWVDQGCRAEFKVGKGDDNSGGGIGGLGAATAGAGALAILGALMGSGSSADNTANYPPDNSGYPSTGAYYPPGGPGYSSNNPNYPYNQQGSVVPNWAIGTFRGNNPLYNTDIELTINPNGQVSGYAGNQPVQGYFRNNQIQVGNLTLLVQPENQGFRTTQAGNPRSQVRYFRVR
ncbi:MAG: DUF3011 domain-containing protein [Candidatus Competibacteraceae bacterium]